MDNIISLIDEIIPAKEKFNRAYRAFEGGIRIITEDENGDEHRYWLLDLMGSEYSVQKIREILKGKLGIPDEKIDEYLQRYQ